MSSSVLLYIVGAMLESWLALMLVFAGRALSETTQKWPSLLAVGLGCNAVRSTLLACGVGNLPMNVPANIWTALLAIVTLGFVTAGLVEYVGIRDDAARRLNTLWMGVLVFFAVSAVLGWISRGGGWLVAAAFGVAWVAFFVRAWQREPFGGHVLVIAALASFPCTVVAVRLGAVPPELLPVAEILPLAVIGITVLTTGAMRSAARARQETAQTAQALAQLQQAEYALRESNATLETRVSMRTMELRETIAGLESFNRSVSHDLRGPLGGIAQVSKLAREYISVGKETEADRLLAAIGRQAEGSVALVGALLDLARAGDAQPHRTQVSTSRLASEVVEALQRERPATPRVTLLAMPTVDADAELLRQVFTNLIANAIKFSEESDPPHIEVGHAKTSLGPGVLRTGQRHRLFE